MNDFTMQMEELIEDLEGNEDIADPDAPLAQEDADGNAMPHPEDNEQPSEDELLDAAHAAMQREDELINIQEMLIESGGVSRDMASSFRDLLPPEMAMESFTAQVTQTNHRMCLEFVGTAIKLAVVTGVVAVLGAIGYALYRISKTKKRMPSNKLDKAVSSMFATVDEKLKVMVEGFRHTHPELEHPNIKWDRQEALGLAAAQSGMQELDVLMITGKYKSLAEQAAPDVMGQADEISKFFHSNVFPELEKMVRGGTGKDIDDITKKVMEFEFADRTTKHLERFGHDMGLKFERADQVGDKFRTMYSQGVKMEDVAKRVQVSSISTSMLPEASIATMYKAQDLMTALTARVSQYEKKMDKSKELPADYVTQVKELLQKCKQPIRSLADAFSVLEMELSSQKRVCKIKALTVSNGFKVVSDFYQERVLTGGENRAGYKEVMRDLQKEFDGVKAALKG